MGKILNKRLYKYITILSLVSIVSSAIAASVILFWPQKNEHPIISFEVEPGMSLYGLAIKLNDKKIISNKRMFCLAVQLLGKSKKIPIGTFNIIDAKLNYQIIDQLVFGIPEVKTVRILEGWNLKQIANHLSEVMNFDSVEVINLAINSSLLKDNNIPALSAEGYLFPDTYFFFSGDTPLFVLNKLISFNKKFWTKQHINKAKKLELTKHEIVTLASIIEGEAIYDSERAKISAVYHNRLNIDMKLQADPTIQYIISDSPRRLLNRDLKIKSPYNTYQNKGLPPGPINSPSKSSLIAALYPEKNDFIYFVANGDGYHTFSTNEKDHNRAKRKLQKIRRQIRREQNTK